MITMLLPVLLLAAALVLDRLFEEPRPALHPVCWMGQAADFWERTLRRDKNSPVGMRLRGLAALLCMEACFVLPALILVVLCQNLWLPLGWCAAAICIWLCLAPHSLARHARAVLAPLHRGNLETARLKLSWIVGRNTNVLDEAGIARASVESVAENCTDGVLSTLFWAFAGYLLGGLPLAAALPVAQRVANTLDAMWGKKNERYIYFGCCAARLDDVFNYLPARVSLFCIALACLFVKGTDAAQALRIGYRFHAAHESPNSAWSEAAFAGALHLKLGGPAIYAGRTVNHPWLGTGTPNATPADISVAIDLMFATTWTCATLFSLIVSMGIVL